MDGGAGHKRGSAYLTIEIAKVVLAEGVCREDVCNLGIYLGTTTWANAAPFHLKEDICDLYMLAVALRLKGASPLCKKSFHW